MPGLMKLGWMPIKECRDIETLLNTVFIALHCNDWPSYPKLVIHNLTWTLRSSKETTLKVSSLPSAAKKSVVFSDFKTQVRKYLINRANVRLIS